MQKVRSAATKYRSKEMSTDEGWPSFLSKQSSESTGWTGKAQIFTELLAWKYFHMCLQAQSKMWVPALLLCLLLLNRHKRLINKVFLILTKRNSLYAAFGDDSWNKCVPWCGHLLSLWLTEFLYNSVFSGWGQEITAGQHQFLALWKG